MGILKNLTEEYFGDIFRNENMVLSDVLKKCIEKGKREKFISYFEGLDRKNRFVIYNEEETMVGEARVVTETEANNILYQEYSFSNYKARCISTDSLLTKPEEYKDYVNCWNKLPVKTKPVFEKIFNLFYEFPVYVSTFIALHFTLGSDKTINILPCEIEMNKAVDILPSKFFYDNEIDSDDRCFHIILPNGYTNLFAQSMFATKINDYRVELWDKFKESGYSIITDIPSSLMRKYTGDTIDIFVKKK